MTWLWAGIYLATVLMVGACVLSGASGRRALSLPEAAGSAFMVGAGTTGTVLFWLSLGGVCPSRWVVGGIALAAIAGLAVLWKLGWLMRVALPRGERALRRADLWVLVPAALAAYCLVVIVLQAAALPLEEIDAYGIWALKAKALAADSLRTRPALFHEPCLAYSHQEYPLLVPLLTAGLFAVTGQTADWAVKLPGAFFYAALGAVAYGFFRGRLSRFWSAAMVAILMTLPITQMWAVAGTADLPLAAFCAGVAFSLARWVAEERWEDLALAALFAAFAGFTKNEGQGLIAVAAVSLGAVSLAGPRKRRLLGWAAFVAATAAILCPWLLWRSGQPVADDYLLRLTPGTVLANVGRLGGILEEWWAVIADPRRSSAFWALLPVLAVLGWRAFVRRDVRLLGLLVALHVGMYTVIYVVAPAAPEELMPGTAPRLLLHAAPAASAWMACHLAAAKTWHGALGASRPARPSRPSGS